MGEKIHRTKVLGSSPLINLIVRTPRRHSLALAFAFVSITATATVETPTSAFASTQGTLQEQANHLATEISSQSIALHALSVQSENDSENLRQLNNAVAKSKLQLAADLRHTSFERALLSRAAISEFVGATSVDSITAIFSSQVNQLPARSAYESMVGTTIFSAIKAYSSAQQADKAQQMQLASALSLARQANETLQNSKSALVAQVTKEESTLSSIRGQIQVLVQQALLAQELAAAKAAAKAAAAKATAVQGLPTSQGIVSVLVIAGTSNWGGIPAPPSPAAFSALRKCESGGNYADNTGNGYYGAYQFSLRTWHGMGYGGLPSSSPPSTQDQAAQRLQASSGWGAWPTCSLILGLR